ncbi:MAG: 30S ribosomal protein S27e [Thermoprotei archaeon]|nr:MAG: 30S ribosomal protein S27e [Thermoprotei archaeon]RLF24548.1 MAG: 30S ribosomal protein S27e [Thermoprotei archaeon]
MVKKRKILVPQPKSKFVRVQCPDCNNEQVIFDHASTVVRCIVCGRVLARPTGGKAKIEAKIIKILE